MTPGDAEKLQRITSHIAIYLGVNGSVATLKAANAEYGTTTNTECPSVWTVYNTYSSEVSAKIHAETHSERCCYIKHICLRKYLSKLLKIRTTY